MKRYKIDAISKAIVIIEGIAYTNGQPIKMEIDENVYNAIKDFVEIQSLTEIGNESKQVEQPQEKVVVEKVEQPKEEEVVEKSKPNVKGANKKAQEIKDEKGFDADDFLTDFDK